jgi:hypothetical protein
MWAFRRSWARQRTSFLGRGFNSHRIPLAWLLLSILRGIKRRFLACEIKGFIKSLINRYGLR